MRGPEPAGPAAEEAPAAPTAPEVTPAAAGASGLRNQDSAADGRNGVRNGATKRLSSSTITPAIIARSGVHAARPTEAPIRMSPKKKPPPESRAATDACESTSSTRPPRKYAAGSAIHETPSETT